MQNREEALKWFQDAKYGLFIHWGLYAEAAGEWKGEKIPWIGEWIMRQARIPVGEYEKLAETFNPVKFDAGVWVSLARTAGMKYLVITAKHHDGFAMFRSRAHPFNIVDATPYGHDIMQDLAEECQRQGVKLCFYYSHCLDWHEEKAVGNHWDFPENDDDTEKNWKKEKMDGKPGFRDYMESKGLPQVREILTQYGPIGLIWYDMPNRITEEESRAFVDVTRECQPNCLISGRIGHGLGDYRSMGDNEIPKESVGDLWETPMTMNDTWGYKTDDDNWKPVKEILRMLVDIVSKGGNFLLNVGPTGEGLIPQPSIDRLQAVGEWLKVNGESIYGTAKSPFDAAFDWGFCTAGDDALYLHVFERPADGCLTLPKLAETAFVAATALATGEPVEMTSMDAGETRIQVPERGEDEIDTVIKIRTEA